MSVENVGDTIRDIDTVICQNFRGYDTLGACATGPIVNHDIPPVVQEIVVDALPAPEAASPILEHPVTWKDFVQHSRGKKSNVTHLRKAWNIALQVQGQQALYERAHGVIVDLPPADVLDMDLIAGYVRCAEAGEHFNSGTDKLNKTTWNMLATAIDNTFVDPSSERTSQLVIPWLENIHPRLLRSRSVTTVQNTVLDLEHMYVRKGNGYVSEPRKGGMYF